MNHPFDDVVKQMKDWIAKGSYVFLKFTCAHCGARQTSDTPNSVNLSGYTCEECKGLTTLADLKRDGINFMLVQRLSGEPNEKEIFKDQIRRGEHP